MKKFGIIIFALIILQAFNLILNAETQNNNNQGNSRRADKNVKVTIGRNLASVEERDSSVNVRVGNRGLSILESLEGTKLKFEKYPEVNNLDEKDTERNSQDEKDNEDHRATRRNRFKGHWSGIEFGFNNYVTSGKSLVLPNDINYMTLNSGKSSGININFAQLNLGLTRHIGFITGLGLNWNNYRFDGNNNILKGDNGVIEVLAPGSTLEKSKLTTVYLDLPFLLELQLPGHTNHLSLAAGPIGAVKLGSHTKMVFEDGPTTKSYRDFSLNMLRYGATVRAGYGNFQLYGTYYMTPLFQTGKGPGGYSLYPFEIGVALTFHN